MIPVPLMPNASANVSSIEMPLTVLLMLRGPWSVG
jgi:hypothetical protein